VEVPASPATTAVPNRRAQPSLARRCPATLGLGRNPGAATRTARPKVRRSVMSIPAPFETPHVTLAQRAVRYAGIPVGAGDWPLLDESWWKIREVKPLADRADQRHVAPELLSSRSSADRYSDRASRQWCATSTVARACRHRRWHPAASLCTGGCIARKASSFLVSLRTLASNRPRVCSLRRRRARGPAGAARPGRHVLLLTRELARCARKLLRAVAGRCKRRSLGSDPLSTSAAARAA